MVKIKFTESIESFFGTCLKEQISNLIKYNSEFEKLRQTKNDDSDFIVDVDLPNFTDDFEYRVRLSNQATGNQYFADIIADTNDDLVIRGDFQLEIA